MKILVTGGMGFIGSHTIVDLLNKGFEVISIDNMSRAWEGIELGIEKITGKQVTNYRIDVCDYEQLESVFEKNEDIMGIIHFAAYKDVSESVKYPLIYYHNNILSTINILKCVEKFGVKHFIFSSSCTVYGNNVDLPVTEDSSWGEPACPYGYTKQIGENLIRDFAVNSSASFIILRYFNPAGAHISTHIGEFLHSQGNHLVPIITQVAAGIRKELVIHGNDYPTRDGTGLRDFIHVMDLAEAHTLALNYAIRGENDENIEVFNLGTGTGITVLEAIEAFESVNEMKLSYRFGPRRKGDIAAIYASNKKAIEKLGWSPKYNVKDIMKTAWMWQQRVGKL
jgi:UDP-glucose 4-epimerase